MKVLIADDDNVNRRILERFLQKWGYEVVTATDGGEAWEMLQTPAAPRLVILDWMMPGLDGTQICKEIRKRDDPTYTYIVMVTAKFQKQDILDGLEAGADDYITKPFDANELQARLRSGRRILELHEELLRSREQLQYQASHDAMTGVWNHGAILEVLGAELARSRRENLPVGAVLLDLDHFKKVNDRYGHLAGDSVLREVVRRLRANVRPYDSIGRYGGEEFLLVCPNSKADTIVNQAERLRLAIADAPLDVPEGNIPITISLGVSAIGAGEAGEVESLLKAADLALYRAKHRGRNRVEVAWENPAGRDRRLAAAATNPAAGSAAGPLGHH